MNNNPESTIIARPEYLGIPVEELTINVSTGFDLFIKTASNYVLFHSCEKPVTEEIMQKIRQRVQSRYIYMRASDQNRYLNYMVENMLKTVEDKNAPTEVRCKKLYDSTVSIVKNAFYKPRKEAVEIAARVIDPLVDLLSEDTNSVKTLTNITNHDPYIYIHSVNVAVLGSALSTQLFPEKDDVRELGFALLMHDIGKSRIERDVLMKPRKLTREEWKIMKEHPTIGVEILKELGFLSKMARTVTLQHHERYDGTGYPLGLKKGYISDFAKICTIADVFEAITSKRPYKKSKATFEALKIMKDEMSGNFDPEMFKAFVYMFRKAAQRK